MTRLRSLMLATALLMTALSSGARAEAAAGHEFDGTYVGTLDLSGGSHRHVTIAVTNNTFMSVNTITGDYPVRIADDGSFTISRANQSGHGKIENGHFDFVKDDTVNIYNYHLIRQ